MPSIRIRDAIVSTDVASDQIACLWNLVRLEANPDLAARFMTRAVAAIDRLDAEGRWAHFGYWIGRFADLGAALRSTRPDVSDVIVPRIAEFNSVARAARLIELAARGDEGRAAAGAIITALGPAIGPPLAIASTTRGTEGREVMSRSGQQLLGEHAPLLAPAVAEALHTAAPSVARALIRMLSVAGAGYEPMVATQLRSADEQTGREALRCLARIGTARAAALVRGAVEPATTWLSGAAVDTLWQFPPAVARKQVLELLSHRMFVLQHPALAARLLDRAAQLGAGRPAAGAGDAGATALPRLEPGACPCGPARARAAPLLIAMATRPLPSMPLLSPTDPLALLKSLVSLRRLTGMYPPGHPAIEQKLGEIDGAVQSHLRDASHLRLDVIHGMAHLDGVSYRNESDTQAQILTELTDLGIDSIHIAPGVSRQELHALAEFLWALREVPSGEAVDSLLAQRGVHHVSLGRLVPLDTRWHAAL